MKDWKKIRGFKNITKPLEQNMNMLNQKNKQLY
jgi:hypothetical protein